MNSLAYHTNGNFFKDVFNGWKTTLAKLLIRVWLSRLDLRSSNVNHQDFEKLPEEHVPDVILVLRGTQFTGEDDTTETETQCSRSVTSKAKRRRQLSVAESSMTLDTTSNLSVSGMEIEVEDSDDDIDDDQWFDVAE